MPDSPMPERPRRRRRRLSRADRDLLWVGARAPRDVAGESLRELLETYTADSGRLIDAQLAGATEWASFRLAEDALEALACGQALADALMSQRWVYVADALRYGAEVRTVARALGLDEDEVRAGLRSWADGQVRLRTETGSLGISDAEHDEVLALLDDRGRR